MTGTGKEAVFEVVLEDVHCFYANCGDHVKAGWCLSVTVTGNETVAVTGMSMESLYGMVVETGKGKGKGMRKGKGSGTRMRMDGNMAE